MKFAHLENGQACDPQFNKSAGEYLSRYSSAVTIKWGPIIEVPDDTEHNAVENQDGIFSNPIPPEPVEIPSPVSAPSLSDVLDQIGDLTQAVADLKQAVGKG